MFRPVMCRRSCVCHIRPISTPQSTYWSEAMHQQELERRALERSKAERTRLIKLAGRGRFLARSRSMEPGPYYELSLTASGEIHCNCPGFSYRAVCKHA